MLLLTHCVLCNDRVSDLVKPVLGGQQQQRWSGWMRLGTFAKPIQATPRLDLRRLCQVVLCCSIFTSKSLQALHDESNLTHKQLSCLVQAAGEQ